MKVLKINCSDKSYELEESEDFAAISYSLNYHLKNETYKEEVFSPKNALCISAGPFLGLDIPGTHRLILSGRSPQIKTYFMSTMGGAGIELGLSGLHAVVLEGKSEENLIIVIRNLEGKFEVLFKNVKEVPNNTINFQKHLIQNYSSYYNNKRYRSLVVGRAAVNTNMGAVHSVRVKDNKIDYGSEGWAGRGGMGSLMMQGHGVAAVMIGGDYKFDKGVNVKQVFKEVFKKPMNEVIYKATEKYRYVDEYETGGTYGVNFFNEKQRTIWFNWQNIYMSEEVRKKLYDEHIKNHYLKVFNEEIIKNKSFKTCGEACVAVCKKVWNKRGNDYEPSIACGPQCGVFDRRDLELFSGTVDDLGFDAIEIGNLIAYVFELVIKKKKKREDFLMEETPVMNEGITLEESHKNARIGAKLATDIALGKLPVFKNGLRTACKKLGEVDFANYMSYGEDGVITPNVYLVPGFLIPLPIQGKFHTFYSKEFHPPRELGKLSAERGVKELYSEECGVCRFHRKWSEELIPILAKKIGFEKDFQNHCLDLFYKIKEYNKLADAEPKFYETKRSKDFLHNYVKIHASKNPDDKRAKEWQQKMDENLEKGVKEYWSELLKGISEV